MIAKNDVENKYDIHKYDVHITYKLGKEIPVTDALLRKPLA